MGRKDHQRSTGKLEGGMRRRLGSKKGNTEKTLSGKKMVQKQAQIFVQNKLAWSVLIDFAGRKREKNKVADVGGIGNAVFSRPSGNGRCTLEGERRQKNLRRRMHALGTPSKIQKMRILVAAAEKK